MIGTLRSVAGELRKLLHPLVAVVAVLFLVFVAAEARTSYHFARLQTPVAVAVQAEVKVNASLACQGVSPSSQQCQLARLNDKLNSRFGDNGEQLGRVTNALSTWPGMLKFVSHHLVTGGGWILIGILVSLQTASEWRSRTAANTLNAIGSVPRFLAAKVASLWVFMLAFAIVLTSVLYALKSAYLGSVGVPVPAIQHADVTHWHLSTLPADPTWSSLSAGVSALIRATAVWLLLIAAGTALAAAIRKPIVVLVVWIAGLAAAVVAGQHGNLVLRTFTRPIGDVLGLSSTPFGIRDTELWHVAYKPGDLNVLPGVTHVDIAGIVVWAGLAAGVALIAGVVASRRRVLG